MEYTGTKWDVMGYYEIATGINNGYTKDNEDIMGNITPQRDNWTLEMEILWDTHKIVVLTKKMMQKHWSCWGLEAGGPFQKRMGWLVRCHRSCIMVDMVDIESSDMK